MIARTLTAAGSCFRTTVGCACALIACSTSTGHPPNGGGTDIAQGDGGLGIPGPLPDGGRPPDGGGVADGGCRTIADCAPAGSLFNGACSILPRLICGGASNNAECFADADCRDAGADQVCVPAPGTCSASACRSRCHTDSDCADGPPGVYDLLACDAASGRCSEKVCATDPDCPPNYSCQAVGPEGSRVCRRRPCGSDTDCQGACVEGRCSTLGTCAPNVPPPP
jgi:hypothetical protein